MAGDRPKDPALTVGDDFELDGDTLASVDGDEPGADLTELKPGSRVGRYMILDQLGQGGMGVVYQAFDPELDRRIALKVLRVKSKRQTQADRSRDRLLREAKALAQLSHPNVVSAYDVGTLGADVFVAMELVDGQTFKEWLRDEKPTVWERVRVLTAAGQGIAAAHRAGLIHRDIKPDNIIVGKDGRVRVLDFGLARAAVLSDQSVDSSVSAESADGSLDQSEDNSANGSLLSGSLTQAGSIVGTPGYMAPEQYLGEVVDAQSDQYSFCVTLYEALYGQRPHRAKRMSSLRKKVLRGRIEPPPAESSVPRHYRRIALRGLSVDAEDRYPAMEALLAELSRDPRVARKRKLIWAAVIAAIGLSFVGAYVFQARKQQLCVGAEQHLAGVWDEQIKEKTKQAFIASKSAYVDDTYQRFEKILNHRAQAWVEMRTEACTATRLRGEQSAQLLDLRMRCLDQRLAETRALTALYAAQVDGKMIRRALPAVRGLSGLARCADAEALQAVIPPPENPEINARVENIRKRVFEVAALQKVGKSPQGLEMAKEIIVEAANLNYAPLQAELNFVLGTMQSDVGDGKAAEESLYRAEQWAARAKDDHLRSKAISRLVFVSSYQNFEQDKAATLARLTESAVIRAGSDPGAMGRILYMQGMLQRKAGHYDEARGFMERAMAKWKESPAGGLGRMGYALNEIGLILKNQNKYQEAKEYYLRALAHFERSLGSHHPALGSPLNNLGAVCVRQKKFEEARSYVERSLAIRLKVLGPDSTKVARTRDNLAAILMEMGDLAGGQAQYEEALRIFEKVNGLQHPRLTKSLLGLGDCFLQLKKADLAIAPLQRALNLSAKLKELAGQHANASFLLAQALWAAGGDRTRARTLARNASEVYRQDGPSWQAGKAEVETWLRAHGGPIKKEGDGRE